jgi:hypothetical protein
MQYLFLGVMDAHLGNPPHFDRIIEEYDTDNEEHEYWAGRHMYTELKAKGIQLDPHNHSELESYYYNTEYMYY